jgi:hypothetical protein
VLDLSKVGAIKLPTLEPFLARCAAVRRLTRITEGMVVVSVACKSECDVQDAGTCGGD